VTFLARCVLSCLARLALASCASLAPTEVLLLDEAFAHIDFETRAQAMRAISDCMAENRTILILVTHEDYDLLYFVEKGYEFPDLVG
jgi:ABC-type nitrate/sulfonate/bicarbonate transport system ATPase subunit